MTDDRHYNDYGTWIRNQFDFRVQKISIDAGFSCPNRDGLISTGGCSFCDNNSFNPSYCSTSDNIKQQINAGKKFFSKKYPNMKYLAYFQAYSNTYGNLNELKRKYEEALECDDVVGLVIGTRPDCVDEDILDYLYELNRKTFIIVEYGIESTDDNILERIGRGHDFECSHRAIKETHERGIITGGHIIIGLPSEGGLDLHKQAQMISDTDLDILKIHQLQIIKGTRLANEYANKPFHVFSADEYIETIAEYIRYIRRDIVIERFVSQSPRRMLIAPDWGLKNYQFTDRLKKYLKDHNIYQGDMLKIIRERRQQDW